jgi:hypothetical protein
MTVTLLATTTLQVGFNNERSEPFTTNIGSPQGDSLSPVLFAIYFECALRVLRGQYSRPTVDAGLPPEICYADDLDFISRSKDHIENIEKIAPSVLSSWNLTVNASKTDRLTLKRAADKKDETWRLTKKLGSLLGDNEELVRRRRLAAAAPKQASNIWQRKRLVREKR